MCVCLVKDEMMMKMKRLTRVDVVHRVPNTSCTLCHSSGKFSSPLFHPQAGLHADSVVAASLLRSQDI